MSKTENREKNLCITDEDDLFINISVSKESSKSPKAFEMSGASQTLFSLCNASLFVLNCHQVLFIFEKA